MFTNKNSVTVKMIGFKSQYVNNYKYDKISVEYGAKKMADTKDEELRKHEQAILWKFENILGKIVLDNESFTNITNDFKQVLINEL